MGTSYNPQAWNGTSGVASNATADAGLGNVESSAVGSPSAVDHWDRGIMAAVRNYVLDTDGGLAAGGTANAITLTTNQALSSAHVAAGLTLSFRATATNTGATTLNVDTIGAVSVVDQFGAALAAGAITSGGIYTVRYNSNTAKWVLVTPGMSTGSYTPTLTGVLNVTATTAYPAYYCRLNNNVIVFGTCGVNPTAIARTQVGISLPVASAFTESIQANGISSALTGGDVRAGQIYGDYTNDRVQLDWFCATTGNQNIRFLFAYTVL